MARRASRPPDGCRVRRRRLFRGPALALSCCAARGARSSWSPARNVAPFAAETLEDVLARQGLHDAACTMRRAVAITAIDASGADAEDEFGEPLRIEPRRWCSSPSAYPRMACGRARGPSRPLPDRRLVAPRLIAEAVFDGHRLAREIEATIPRWRCPICASASETAPSYRPPPPLRRSRPSRRAPRPRGANASSSRASPWPPSASTRCCEPGECKRCSP